MSKASSVETVNESGIIRVHKDRSNPYTMIMRATLEDDRLSWEARGVLAYLLAKPDDWHLRTVDLIKRSPAGRDKVRHILNELSSFGYLRRTKRRTKSGTFVWDSEVYEAPATPFPAMDNPATVNPATVNPATVQPSPGKASHTNNEVLLITNVTNKEATNDEGAITSQPIATGEAAPETLNSTSAFDQQDDLLKSVESVSVEADPSPQPASTPLQDDGFDTFFKSFWDRYPAGKEGKLGRRATRDWLYNTTTSDLWPRILTALSRYRTSERVTLGFVKSPTSWLLDWEDWETEGYTEPLTREERIAASPLLQERERSKANYEKQKDLLERNQQIVAPKRPPFAERTREQMEHMRGTQIYAQLFGEEH